MIGLIPGARRRRLAVAATMLWIALGMAGCGSEPAVDIYRASEISEPPRPPCTGVSNQWLAHLWRPVLSSRGSRALRTVAVAWLPDGSGVLFTKGTRLYAAAADGTGLQLLHDASGEISIETTGRHWEARSRNMPSDWTDPREGSEPAKRLVGPVRFVAERLTAASVAADGSKIAFVVCRDQVEGQTYAGGAEGVLDVPAGRLWVGIRFDLYEIFVWDRGSGTIERLAIGGLPKWSPDGQRLAFITDHDYTTGALRGTRLNVLDADSGQVWEVARSAFDAAQWSPDGRRIAFVLEQGPRRPADSPRYVLRIVTADDAHGSQLELAGGVVSDPAWSPDGRRLAFAKADGEDVALYTMAADGTDAQRVALVEGWRPDGAYLSRPTFAWISTVAWSPDGTRLLYTCGAQVCVVRTDGTPVGQSPVSLPNGSLAAWSPDSTRIAVGSVGLNRSSTSVRSGGEVVLYTMAPDGTDERILVVADPYARERLIAVGAQERP